MNFDKYTTEDIINSLPENQPLYKDSGTWNIYTDDFKDVISYQNPNETMREYLIRHILENVKGDNLINLKVDLACSQTVLNG